MSSFIERFTVFGTAALLGLMGILATWGFLSLLGADPKEPLDRLESVEEALTPESDTPADTVTVADEAGQPPAGPGQEAPGSAPPSVNPRATATPRAAVLTAARSGQGTPTPAPRGGAAGTATNAPTTAPTKAPTPKPTAIATPAPTPGATSTPAPESCSVSGTPSVRLNGKHVRIQYGTVVSFGAVLVVEVAGTIEVFQLTELTEILGNLSAATLVHAQGRRADDGTVIAERVEVLCPDSARG